MRVTGEPPHLIIGYIAPIIVWNVVPKGADILMGLRLPCLSDSWMKLNFVFGGLDQLEAFFRSGHN